MPLAPVFFRIVALICAAGTSHEDCRPGSDATLSQVEGPSQASIMSAMMVAPKWFADYAARNNVPMAGREVIYYFPEGGAGKLPVEPYGVVSGPQFKRLD